jgi:predicted ABC-type ATPase
VRTDRPDLPDADNGLADQRLDADDPAHTDDPQRGRDDPRPGSDEEMRDRLKDLPDGHPSSPYYDDGSPKPPVLRLKDIELPEADTWEEPDQPRRLTDSEHIEHVKEVRSCLEQARADGLATNKLRTIDLDGEAWDKERRIGHGSIIQDLYERSAHVPNEYQALIAGGLGGAGKSTVLDQYAGIDRSQYMTINPDEIKEEMAGRGMVPQVDGLSPMEASDLVHEESSHIAKQLALRAQGDGKNLIWDITMSTQASTDQRIDDLRSAGYTRVDGIFVHIPVETSVNRADARHREGHDDYLAGKGLGGRFVPQEVIRQQADPEWGSLNRKNFESAKDRFDSWSIYDNSIDGGIPMLVDALQREEKAL